MKFKDRVRNAIRAFTTVQIGSRDDELELMRWLGIDSDGMNKGELNEVTYFTCLKKLSETIGKLPIKYYKDIGKGKARADPDQISYLLSVRPNQFITPTTFWTAIECNCQHYGNAYVWINEVYTKAAGYQVKDLWIMPSEDVTVLIDDKGIFGKSTDIYYRYTDRYTHEQYVFASRKVMHFKTWLTFDGIIGQPVREILKAHISGALESQKYMGNLYKNGMTAAMALQYTSDLEDAKVRKLQKKFETYMSGPMNAGRIVPVPLGLTLTPLNIKLTDAQFFELKKYSALQIAAAFGIKPNQINDYDKSSYASAEMQQLDFLVDTIMPRLKLYEEEINYKLLGRKVMIEEGRYFKFNEKALLRTDSKTQADILTSFVNNAIYTPNEARDYLDKEFVEEGDLLIANGNYIPLKDVGKQYGIKAEGGDRDE
jgi:HK97 family phage portal protein